MSYYYMEIYMGEVVAMTVEGSAAFDYLEAFWMLVWRKEGKKDTRAAWAKVNPRDYVRVLEATVAWRPIYMARATEFRPLPATWIRGERYEDEVPQEYVQVASAAHSPAKLPDLPAKGEIPAGVLAALAKYRK